MHSKRSIFLLFALIILEGYVVLSSELLAIRLSLPFVGSGTDTVSIIIAAVLMPLALGYYMGGRYKPGFQNGRYNNVRKTLVRNMMIALAFLVPGLSYVFLQGFYDAMMKMGITNRLVFTCIYAGLFLVIPVYLLGQTIPLVSHYFSKEQLSRITGKILFFSTLGSFAGAVVSTLILMSLLGVHYTAALNFLILTLLIFAMSKNTHAWKHTIAVAASIAGLALNSTYLLGTYGIVKNNAYNTIAVYNVNDTNYLYLNNNASSKYSPDGNKFKYVEFIERVVIGPIWNGDDPKDILVLGAGGFTLGHEDYSNRYDYVDIDKDLKEVGENEILKEEIGANKTFHPVPARAFLIDTDKKYDVIVLDVYSGFFSLPEHLITIEFFKEVKAHLKDGGVLAANLISAPHFANAFARNLDTTFRAVFPFSSRAVIHDKYDVWEEDENIMRNVVYIYKNHTNMPEPEIYSDLKNRSFLDQPAHRNR